ncbi:WD40-repeat-containing domain protein [Kockovaella imperatae]|uniref:WD40-repeat-containing domain protein n=1 Tax=Kockovaella imperatae TaxID=4999 RepID=A0A1Y1U918_9TREE|nr:WD40-repeat-containing domain protein [Kockovaella imperatae]ORX34502.1 WD40-repeat-containing domain protein [Kockovaella imperatae]
MTSAPVFNFGGGGTRLADIKVEGESRVQNNFARSARWCADGSSILVTAEDRIIRVVKSLKETTIIACPDAVVSTSWYPSASGDNPATHCFVAGIRDSPVRLVDASDGRIRAQYPIVDHRERVIAPHSLAFNPDASKLYCGFDSAIEVFDVSNPGHGTSDRLVLAKDAQKGLVSALAFAPDYSGIFAAGDYNGAVALYSEGSAAPIQHVDGVVGGGVTQIAFNPIRPTMMLVAARRSGEIQAFDTRDLSKPVKGLQRDGWTNQRLDFGLDPWGRYLAVGDQRGTVKIWDTETLELVCARPLSNDAIGSVQMHPLEPWILTASGSRKTIDSTDSDNDSDEEASDNESSGSSDEDHTHSSHVLPPVSRSLGLALWSFT